MRVLLAEDDPMLGDGLRAGLRQLGFQVDWVRDGPAAERELSGGEYTAAVLDLMRVQIDDGEWKRAMEAIRGSIQAVGTATYVRVYRRVGASGQYEAVPLDLAAV